MSFDWEEMSDEELERSDYDWGTLGMCNFSLEDKPKIAAWKTVDGRLIPYSEMSDEHVLNAFRQLQRREKRNRFIEREIELRKLEIPA